MSHVTMSCGCCGHEGDYIHFLHDHLKRQLVPDQSCCPRCKVIWQVVVFFEYGSRKRKIQIIRPPEKAAA